MIKKNVKIYMVLLSVLGLMLFVFSGPSIVAQADDIQELKWQDDQTTENSPQVLFNKDTKTITVSEGVLYDSPDIVWPWTRYSSRLRRKNQ